MHCFNLVLPVILAATASAGPLPSVLEAEKLARDLGAEGFDPSETTAAPDWALSDLGLIKRGELRTCQPDDDGGQSGLTRSGDKNWVPVDQWLTQANEFCSDRSGVFNQIPLSQSQTFSGYAVTLTNQKTPSVAGDPGHIAFFVINEGAGPTAAVNMADCYNALQHISGWKGSPVGQSPCWGSKNNDTRGGTWALGNGWVVGGAVSPGSPATS